MERRSWGPEGRDPGFWVVAMEGGRKETFPFLGCVLREEKTEGRQAKKGFGQSGVAAERAK